MFQKWFCLILLLVSNSIIGQNRLDSYTHLVEQFSNDQLTTKVDSLLVLIEDENDFESLAKIAHEFVLYHYFKNDLTLALVYSLKEVSALEQAEILDESYANALYNTGRFYYANSEYQIAIEYYEKVLTVGSAISKHGNAYADIGRCFTMKGDFYKATIYLEKGLKLLKSQKQYRSYAIQSINLAEAYRNIDIEESRNMELSTLRNAESLSSPEDMGWRNYLNLLDGIADWYNSIYNYNFKKAQSQYFTNLSQASLIQDSVAIARTYNNLANLYNLDKNDSAMIFIKKGFRFIGDQDIQARLYDNRGEYYILNEQLDLALESIHKALEISLNVKFSAAEVPEEYTLSQSSVKGYTLFCLKKKIEILLRLYERTKDSAYLTHAIANSLAADLLIDIIQEDASESRSKLHWRKEASTIYLQGAYASYLTEDKESAFFFIEKNKALLLSEEIVRNTSFSALPKNIYNLKMLQKKQISSLESRLVTAKNQQLVEQLKDSLFDAKLIFENYLTEIESQYPEYFQNHPQIKPTSLTQAKERLKDNDVLISFIWNQLYDGSELIIGLASNKDETLAFEVRLDDDFVALLTKYKKDISKPFKTKEDQFSFQQVSADLFDRLFPSEAITDMLVNKNLIIVTDGDLQNISFDALISDRNTNRYLLETSNISYLYSTSFLSYNENVKRRPDKKFIGYAPIDFTNSELNNLLYTEAELASIKSVVGGNTFLNEKATKAHFLKHSGAYDIIHLATHASEEVNPWIAFADEKLELRELFSHKTNADLVVLSACNTSLGEMAQGEGILSLTRGFFYSGAKSVVSSLWSVNDKSTKYIIAQFYLNLESGQSKTEALNHAKRSYLKNHSLSELSPYYWSAFILIGDVETISFSANTIWYIVAFVTFVLFVFLFFKKKILS